MQPMQLGEQVAKQFLFCYDSFSGVQVLWLFILNCMNELVEHKGNRS